MTNPKAMVIANPIMFFVVIGHYLTYNLRFVSHCYITRGSDRYRVMVSLLARYFKSLHEYPIYKNKVGLRAFPMRFFRSRWPLLLLSLSESYAEMAGKDINHFWLKRKHLPWGVTDCYPYPHEIRAKSPK